MARFFTRRGDDGRTGLLGRGRYPKHHPRLEALGSLDEASAALGLARALSRDPRLPAILVEVQRDLYAIMAEVAANPAQADRFRTLDRSRLDWLEAQAAALSKDLPELGGFILPGETASGAACSLARTVVRRAERWVSRLAGGRRPASPVLLPYLNRLSSLCFILELVENQGAGKEARPARKGRDGPESA